MQLLLNKQNIKNFYRYILLEPNITDVYKRLYNDFLNNYPILSYSDSWILPIKLAQFMASSKWQSVLSEDFCNLCLQSAAKRWIAMPLESIQYQELIIQSGFANNLEYRIIKLTDFRNPKMTITKKAGIEFDLTRYKLIDFQNISTSWVVI